MRFLPLGQHIYYFPDGVIFRTAPHHRRLVGPILCLHESLFGPQLILENEDPSPIGEVPVVGIHILGDFGVGCNVVHALAWCCGIWCGCRRYHIPL